MFLIVFSTVFSKRTLIQEVFERGTRFVKTYYYDGFDRHD